MRSPVPPFVRWAVALAVLVALTVAVFQYWGTTRQRLATVPGATVPSATVPSATVPGATVPGATVPGATVPGATVPGAKVQSTAHGQDVTGQEQRIDQVVNTTSASLTGPAAGGDVNAMAAALVLIAALLVVLCLVGITGRRIRRPDSPQHRCIPHRRRHAAQRW